ncbi:mitochondrial 54S ribosomal protein uL10m [Kockiozyma suomiensis]|uniref:mitochondrial 54S ribosomal protein uL10m n=1 Tax=Kockiozyma suomiensis TaxID=1337062 RepID=UPI0033435ED2
MLSLLPHQTLGLPSSVSRVFTKVRNFAQVATEIATSQTSAESLPRVRNTVKALDSRKTYLIDRYTYILRSRPVQLYVQHNNLCKADSFLFRGQFKKLGIPFTVVNTSLFKVTLKGIKADDPASWEARSRYRWTKKEDRHPAMQLVSGPTALVSFETLDPELLSSAVEIIERSGGRLLLMGAVIDNKLFSHSELEKIKKLGSFDQVRAELAGVLEILRGAGLVNTLSSTSTGLYLTLDARKKQLGGDDEDSS